MIAARKVANGLEANVGSQHEEAHGDHLLSPPLGRLGGRARGGEAPQQHEPGDGLDQGVRPEAHQRNGPGSESGDDRDSCLDAVPSDPEPCEQLRPAYQYLSPMSGRPFDDRESDFRSHSESLRWILRWPTSAGRRTMSTQVRLSVRVAALRPRPGTVTER